jgi:Phospholipase_D-nuclease N-terminal
MIAIRGVLLFLGVFAAAIVGIAIIGLVADWFDLTVFGFLMVVGFLLLWGGALYDIWRRSDLSSGSRLIWTGAVLVVPILGTLIYALVRPAAVDVTYTGEQTA